MILPRRQQAVLDRMDRALSATDPSLRSSYAAFARRAQDAPFPKAEVISNPVRLLVLVLVIVLAVGFLAFGISVLHGGCPTTAGHVGCIMSHNG